MDQLIRSLSLTQLFLATLGVLTLIYLVFVLGVWWLLKRAPGFGKVIEQRPLRAGQDAHELRAGLTVLLVDAVVITLVHYYHLIPREFNSWGAFWLTLLVSFIYWEIGFYLSHRFFHTRWGYRFHKGHHMAYTTQALSTVSHSVVERLVMTAILFALPIFLARFFPFSFHGFLVYMALNYAYNVYGHANREFTPKAVRRRLPWLNTPTYHALHHSNPGVHFGLYLSCWDDWWGGRHADYPAIHERVLEGKGVR